MQRKKIHDINLKLPEPDKELVLWEKWIQIRNEEVAKLGKKLQKPPTDLTMNLLEKVREKKEWKTALEHAKIEKKPSLRGNLWEQPLRLKQPCYYCMPAYIVQRTPAEMGKPSVIEHVSVPQYIQEVEKGIIGTTERIECSQLNADFLNYKEKRELDLKDKLVKIDPFRPKASDLIVIGSKPKTPPPKLPPLPDIVITPMEGVTEDICTVYAVRINNTVIVKDIPGQDLSHLERMKQEAWHEPCTKWCYYFNVPVKRAGRCKVFLKNLGTVTLRYCWKRIKRPIPFIPEDIYEQVFFFNKNEDVLSPGQSNEIFFTFISNKPGVYCEFWELSFCNICFYDTMSEKIRVNLYGDSVENVQCIRDKFEKLKARIDTKAIYNIVSDIINDAINEATTVKPQQYPYKNLFLEAEMFVLKNPVCFYHQTEVMKMKNLYSEMLPGKSWDLSICSWREAMIAKEFDDRMKYYELLRKSHSEFLKPWYEGDDLLKQKYRATVLLLGQMADMFDKKYDQLLEIYNPLTEDGEVAGAVKKVSVSNMDPMTRQQVRNVFYIHAYEYVSITIEMCAGVLSSLDLNRWIEFDFCRI